ncbi:hypothetical protein B0T14DRAFT_523572 [Immersiella caudata]|uniref:Uncharacterized protein n=1 Tax=Immersiella caudata TaxID=314043 RepID=A0AA40BWX7_9PEZI|nr:hypothetical protein B0T14DRAFT_523572 [Immersiella caudata]
MPSPVRPATDARHRRACFSLFRALLRQGRRVPLPDDITPGLLRGPTNPIQALIARAFRKNRKDTSKRLVVSALQNGYRFLTLLDAAAQSPPQPARNEVLSFLRDNQSRVLAARARAAANQPPPKPPPALPVLTLVSENPIVYKPTQPPLPLSAFKSGVRRIPHLDMCNTTHPFLRFRKPQSPKLSSALLHRHNLREANIIASKKFREEDMDFVEQEDKWENQLRRLMRADPEKTTYKSTLIEVMNETHKWLHWDFEDALARGKALWEIVERERALAKREKKDARTRASRERKARIAKGEVVETVGLEKFERHLEEKRRMWPPVGVVRRRRVEARAERRAEWEKGDQPATL